SARPLALKFVHVVAAHLVHHDEHDELRPRRLLDGFRGRRLERLGLLLRARRHHCAAQRQRGNHPGGQHCASRHFHLESLCERIFPRQSSTLDPRRSRAVSAYSRAQPRLCYDYANMRIVEKAQIMSAAEIDRTLQRLAHEIVEKSGGTKHLALIGIRRRGVPLPERTAKKRRPSGGVDAPGGRLNTPLYGNALPGAAPRPTFKSPNI